MPEIVILSDGLKGGSEYIHLLCVRKGTSMDFRSRNDKRTTGIANTERQVGTETVFAYLIVDPGMEDTMIAGDDNRGILHHTRSVCPTKKTS